VVLLVIVVAIVLIVLLRNNVGSNTAPSGSTPTAAGDAALALYAMSLLP
jgi:hypothetical protein